MDKESFLCVYGLKKKYGETLVVDNLNFSVQKSEVFGLLGPNGAGKTTTIKMLCGLLKPDAGNITLDGFSTSTGYNKVKSRIGLCPQEIVVWEFLTCLEQLKFMGISYGLSSTEAVRRAENLLDILGLLDKKNSLSKNLSGGMQRRLNIALALIHDPELIILDEPQAGLDPQSRILVRDFIRQLSKTKSVILTTHDMDEADRLSDRIAIIDHGKILCIDTPENIKKQAGTKDILQVRVEISDEILIDEVLNSMPITFSEKSYSDGFLLLGADKILELIPTVNSILKSFNLNIVDITVRKRTLEDAFISMTGRRLHIWNSWLQLLNL